MGNNTGTCRAFRCKNRCVTVTGPYRCHYCSRHKCRLTDCFNREFNGSECWDHSNSQTDYRQRDPDDPS
jgi:hypothetical protein